jgi:hypothetical protein
VKKKKLCFSVENISIPEEKISEYCEKYALTPDGKKAITLHLGNLKHDLNFIADNIDLPEDAESRLSELFGDWDNAGLACFIYTCFIYTKLFDGARGGNIENVLDIVYDVSTYVFHNSSMIWLEEVLDKMKEDEPVKLFMANVYYDVIGSHMSMNVLDLFDDEELPPLERHEGEEEEEEEEEQDGDEEVEPSSEEEEVEQPKKEQTLETFKEEREKLDAKMIEYMKAFVTVFVTYVLKPGKKCLEQGKELTILFNEISDKIPKPAIKLTTEVLTYIFQSPGLWFGLFLFMWLGQYVPLQGGPSLAVEWFLQWASRKGKQMITNTELGRLLFL